MAGMKPLLSAPFTDADEGIWADVIDRTARDTALGLGLTNMFVVSEDADRRDARLMLCLRVQAEMGTCYLRIGAHNYAVPAVQVYLLRNPLFPSGAGYPFNITDCA